MSIRYHINRDSLGETSEFQAEEFAAAVQKSLPTVEIILCPEGQPQSNTEEAENLCEPEVSRIWDSMEWFSCEMNKETPFWFNVFAYLDQQEKQEIKKGNARLLLVTGDEERDLALTPDDVLDFCPDEWREQYDLLCQAVFNPDMEIGGVLNIMEEQLARIKRTRQ